MDKEENTLQFYVNGVKKEIASPHPSTTLLKYLRNELGLTGTKNGCDQGGCGVCTVMVSWWDPTKDAIQTKNINACITLICYLHGFAITTVEGVGSQRNGLHPIQERLVSCHGIQCGYCSPGMVMSAVTLSKTDSEPSLERLEQALEGNLCRCTGYRSILESFKPLCKASGGKCGDIEDICELRTSKVNTGLEFTDDWDVSSDLKTLGSNTARFVSRDMIWIRPTSLQEVVRLMRDIPGARLIMGATAMSYGLKKGHLTEGTLICCSHVQEMKVFTVKNDVLEVGAAVELSTIEKRLNEIIAVDESGRQNTCFQALRDSVRWLGSDQVKNTGTIGGHLAVCDPRSDLYPVLMALGAKAVIASEDGQLEVSINEDFISGPWKSSLKRSDVMVTIRIPTPKNNKIFYYKQGKRKSFDYALANACFNIALTEETVASACLCFGQIGQISRSAPNTAKLLVGKKLNATTFGNIQDVLTDELRRLQGESGNKNKLQLAQGFFRKFWNHIAVDANKADAEADSRVWGTSKGTQVWEAPSPTQPDHDAVGKPIHIVGGPSLVTGNATFVGDMPRQQGEVWVELVCSTKAHAKILSIDMTDARKVPGFVDYMDSSWIPGKNEIGIALKDDVLFANTEVNFYGQPVGAILADTEEAGKRAAALVRIEYKDLPAILTLEDAISQESFIPMNYKPVQCGDPDREFENCDVVREGVIKSGHLEHMYMEPNASIAIPHEDRELEVFVTTQMQQFCQKTIMELLNIPANRVTLRTKRIGGAFGGKNSRPLYVCGPAAVAAYRTGRAARCILDRYTDFMITGKRNPFLVEYKAGFKKNGKIHAIKLKVYVDAGYSADVTVGIINKIMFHADGCYKIPNYRIEGHVCRTHTASNTTFRAFGTSEGAYIIESLIADFEILLTVSPEQIRSTNLYKEGDTTHYNTVVTNFTAEKCWNECMVLSNFTKKKEQVQKFNESHESRKRGLAIMPCKCSISYPNRSSNQGCALVNVYLDGSVLIAHGGIEMGQGLYTKTIQIASRALGVPVDNIHISETGTNITPNPVPTAASVGTDLFGEAVLNACTTLRERLDPLQDKNTEMCWTDLVQKAFSERINLSATGLSRVGTNHRDFEKQEGEPFNYYTYGAGCSLVEIDCLTGEHQVLSADIVMDVGKSLNPGIDIGQIEGAFVQGYGWMTSEEIKVKPDGRYNVSGPVEYKIPNVKDIPREIKVSLLKDCPNERAVYSSKGIGEPPLLLSISVYLALRDAITTARRDAGLPPVTRLDVPLTAEVIRSACP